MSDFTSNFWSVYVALLTILSIAGCFLLLWVQAKAKIVVEAGQEAKTTGHSWDEGLAELNNPMPRWWMWMFYITIIFGVVYLVLYPGLGSFKGKLGWESVGQYQAELKKADQDFGPIFAKYQAQDLKAVAADPQARAMGERLFLTYCSQCHGSDARGNKGYPNLADGDWLYGGEPDMIKTTIMSGRNGVMPAMAAALGSDKDVEAMAHYVLTLSGATADAAKVGASQEKFAVCAACHGPEGKGNPALGAPNLTDKTWLHGGSMDTIKETITKGRNSTMPSFKDFLGEDKVHLLAAYVWGLSNTKATVAQK